ncbi:MAG: hypothetical protein AB1791_11615 [Chloroflexota bacterium]
MDFEYKVAADLDHAWLNFELDLPLEAMPGGAPNPFYVNRPGNPAARLERELLRPYRQPPKYFFSGHRGCGKSTELRRLAAQPAILAKYWPIHFTIRDEADVNNLDYKDVLLAVGGRMFRAYREQGGKLPDQLLRELDTWRGQVEEVVTIVTAGRIPEADLEGKLNLFFGEAGLRVKLEPTTRRELRQAIERNVAGLISVINNIATVIQAKEKRPPLVLIDDLDKPDLDAAKAIFYERRASILQPICPIVYTVSSSLFYSPEFEGIRDRAIFLPNVKLHPQGEPDSRDPEGYYTLRMFVHQRMQPELINDEALDLAAKTSGGVFRELARVMRYAVDRAMAAGQPRLEVEDVQGAAAEIRGEYRRILTAEQRALLRDIYHHNRMDEPDRLAPLMQILAALEYANGEPWCDVHPALVTLLDEMESHERAPTS